MTQVNIIYDNIWAYLDTPIDLGVAALLYENLKYHADGYQHSWLYKSKKWDGYTHLFDTTKNRFRLGLLKRVIKLLSADGFTVKVKNESKRAPSVIHSYNEGIIRPYDHQSAAIDAICDNNMGIIVAPTGVGKTAILGKAIAKIESVTLVIVPDLILLDQMHQALSGYFSQPIGMIGDQEFDLQNITVSTIQSLLSFTKKPPANDKLRGNHKAFHQYVQKIGCVMIDEVHNADSDSFDKVMPLFIYATKFIGTSATPYGLNHEGNERRSNIELEQHVGSPIYDCRKQNFIELGLKVPCIVNTHTQIPINSSYTKHKKSNGRGVMVPDNGKNYRDALETEILNNPNFHNEVASKMIELNNAGKTAYVYAAHSIEYGESICDLIPGAELINGSTPREERRRIYDAFRKKEILTVVSDVGVAGLDVPTLDAVALASDMQDVRQLLGRVSRRPYGGSKELGLVLDFNIPTQFFKSHYIKRCMQYDNEGYPVIGERYDS